MGKITDSNILKYRGIIFDMDNTLLSSEIDFEKMKYKIFYLLQEYKVISQDENLKNHSVSTLIEKAKKSKKYNNEINEKVWRVIDEIETEGLKKASLEPGAKKILDELSDNYTLAVFTNNSHTSASKALEKNKIDKYFTLIVTRKDIDALKPSPEGVLYIVNYYQYIDRSKWLFVGDSWIDGKSAIEAGVDFLAYKACEKELSRKGVLPIGIINHLTEIREFFF